MSMTLGRASGNSAPIATVATAGAASADCCIPCDIPVFCRNHYYRGKLLTEREFADEQRYFVNKARLHTLALHGWGVACGLHVKPHPYCPELRLVIEEGLAIDACGRDIRVLTEVTIDLPQPPASPENNRAGARCREGSAGGAGMRAGTAGQDALSVPRLCRVRDRVRAGAVRRLRLQCRLRIAAEPDLRGLPTGAVRQQAELLGRGGGR